MCKATEYCFTGIVDGQICFHFDRFTILLFSVALTEQVHNTDMGCIGVSSAKGFPSSPHLVDRKKSGVGKKMSVETSAVSASRLAALPVTTNKTIFFLPGVDIKVCSLL